MKRFVVPRKILEWLLEREYYYYYFEIVDEKYLDLYGDKRSEYVRSEEYYFRRDVFVYSKGKIEPSYEKIATIISLYSPEFILLREVGEQERFSGWDGFAELTVLVVDELVKDEKDNTARRFYVPKELLEKLLEMESRCYHFELVDGNYLDSIGHLRGNYVVYSKGDFKHMDGMCLKEMVEKLSPEFVLIAESGEHEGAEDRDGMGKVRLLVIDNSLREKN